MRSSDADDQTPRLWNILQVLRSVDPEGGGPMEAVLQSGLELRRRGHSVHVASLDDPDAPYVRKFPLPLHALGPGFGGYGYSARLTPWLQKYGFAYDAIILNGLWQYHTFGSWRALKRVGCPYYVFPHGMLDPWFKREFPLKHLKKQLYWPWGEYRVLRDARAVLFTCEEECRLARQSFSLYRARERVMAFGTSSPPVDAEALRAQFLESHPELRDRRLLLFLGRIHPKKGCDLLITAFAQIAARDARLQLIMAGPDHAGWSTQLQRIASDLGIARRVSWPGMLSGSEKWGAFYSAEVFILPSHQENFGIAVVEALGCGLPVLISDKVNIWREIVAARAGFCEEDTDEGTGKLLLRWLSASQTERRDMAEKAKQLFRRKFTVAAMADDLLKLIAIEAPSRVAAAS